MSLLKLMENHVNVLFKHNEKGKITFINEPPHINAPRLFIGATKEGNVVRYHHSLGDDVVKELGAMMKENPSSYLAEIIRILNHDQEINDVGIGLAYVFPDVRNRETTAIQVTPSNKEILKPHFPYTFEEFEYKQPCYAIVHNEIAVSLCCSARETTKAAEASLYTLEEFRGKGYGVEVANAWAADVQKQGRMALYSTSWDNFSSQTVAKKLQLIHYGTDITIN